jgi:hypothetical protein
MVGTSDGDIYKSENALWTGANTSWGSTRPRAGFVASIAFEPGSQDIVYATYAGFGGPHVWRSGDYGATWEAIDGTGVTALPDIPVHSIVVDPDNPHRLYLGTDLGVFTTPDRGNTWMVENTGFANAVTEWITLGDGPGERPVLFAFTHGRGAWRVELMPLQEQPRRSGGRVAP